MRKLHQKNTVRYFLIVIAALFFLFLSGDFGLIDVQKTAIVMAVGIDREDDTFIVTSQIAVPKASDSGKSSETVQIVSRGNTVADAFEEINAKTGWYPKLVFCRLILLGEKTAQDNAVDALDFFLLDEYLSDNCLVATCDGFAKDILNVKALVDASGSVAIQKVLSSHAQRVGTVLPSTLREFSIGYYSESKSSFLPVLKTQPQQEEITGDTPQNGGAGGSQSNQQSEAGSQDSQSGQSNQSGQSGGEAEKPVFSASETALFYAGKRVGTLTEEETFAFNAVKNKLRLASYSVEADGNAYSLAVKSNSPKTSCKLGKDGRAAYSIRLTLSAGLLDSAKAFEKTEGIDVGDVPTGAFAAAEKLLSAQISSAFEKARVSGCDVFGVLEALQKRENKRFAEVKNTALENTVLDVSVRFKNVR
ncbi:MAG: hypothetical protein IJ329_01120 [Clostridia bacterium]|nr:hypothetical protein [Clostridia bacterium]